MSLFFTSLHLRNKIISGLAAIKKSAPHRLLSIQKTGDIKSSYALYKTKKVFWDDPYQRMLETQVAMVNGDEVLFKETIAFSFSGGQESDKATVNGIQILNSRLDGNNIVYTLPTGHSFGIGDKVIMEIDWPRRNRLMRLHFACELILVIFNRLFANKKENDELKPEEIDHVGIEKTGAHIAEDKARIDFKSQENISIYFSRVQAEYQKIIEHDLPIEKNYLDEVNQLRYWRIKGIATVPCGGTHLNSTAEIGLVRLKREGGGKDRERVKITLENPKPASEGHLSLPLTISKGVKCG